MIRLEAAAGIVPAFTNTLFQSQNDPIRSEDYDTYTFTLPAFQSQNDPIRRL